MMMMLVRCGRVDVAGVYRRIFFDGRLARSTKEYMNMRLALC